MKICTKCNLQCDDTAMYCPQCGETLKSANAYQQPQKPTNKMKNILIVSIVVNVVVLLILAWSASYADPYNYSYSNTFDYYDKEEQFYLFDTYARIVPDDGSGEYHRYGCEYLDEDAGFWIYDIWSVKDYATPCLTCCADD